MKNILVTLMLSTGLCFSQSTSLPQIKIGVPEQLGTEVTQDRRSLAQDQVETAIMKHKDIQVKVIAFIPTSTQYNWNASGASVTSCYGYTCESSYVLPQEGTASASGAVLRLLLPDNSIVIAVCSMKPDNAGNWANTFNSMFNGQQISTIYRNCRTPATDYVMAQFRGKNVKLFMQEPGRNGKRYSETYSIRGMLQPSQN